MVPNGLEILRAACFVKQSFHPVQPTLNVYPLGASSGALLHRVSESKILVSLFEADGCMRVVVSKRSSVDPFDRPIKTEHIFNVLWNPGRETRSVAEPARAVPQVSDVDQDAKFGALILVDGQRGGCIHTFDGL